MHDERLFESLNATILDFQVKNFLGDLLEQEDLEVGSLDRA